MPNPPSPRPAVPTHRPRWTPRWWHWLQVSRSLARISCPFGLFALWPFTRLVHVFSAPLGYLTRPYIVYRSRDDKQLGSHSPRRGWERVK